MFRMPARLVLHATVLVAVLMVNLTLGWVLFSSAGLTSLARN